MGLAFNRKLQGILKGKNYTLKRQNKHPNQFRYGRNVRIIRLEMQNNCDKYGKGSNEKTQQESMCNVSRKIGVLGKNKNTKSETLQQK